MEQIPKISPEANAGTRTQRVITDVVFTEREIEVIREVITGASNREIAQRMSLSVDAIKYHMKNILKKSGCNTRTEFAVYVCRNGLLPPEA